MSTIIASANGQVIQKNEKLTAGTMTDKYGDTELIRLLCGDEAMQDKALVFIMSHMRAKIVNSLCKKGCTAESAEGFFLEGLTKAVQTIEKGQYRGGSLEGFLRTASNNVWFSALRKDKARIAREEKVGHTMMTAEITADDLVFYEQRAILLKDFLQKLGAGCSPIMLLKAEGYSSKEIVEMTDYSSVGAIDRRYHVCLKKVRVLMKDNPQVMKLLKELHEK